MEASETCGGSETIWHLQALFGKGVGGSGGALGVVGLDELLQALKFGSELMRKDLGVNFATVY